MPHLSVPSISIWMRRGSRKWCMATFQYQTAQEWREKEDLRALSSTAAKLLAKVTIPGASSTAQENWERFPSSPWPGYCLLWAICHLINTQATPSLRCGLSCSAMTKSLSQGLLLPWQPQPLKTKVMNWLCKTGRRNWAHLGMSYSQYEKRGKEKVSKPKIMGTTGYQNAHFPAKPFACKYKRATRSRRINLHKTGVVLTSKAILWHLQNASRVTTSRDRNPTAQSNHQHVIHCLMARKPSLLSVSAKFLTGAGVGQEVCATRPWFLLFQLFSLPLGSDSVLF